MFSPQKILNVIFFVFFKQKMIKNFNIQQKLKRFCTFLHLYVFYVCATFHCIWRSGFEVICTLVSALKSNMAAMETNRGTFFLCAFFIFFILIIIHIQWNDWVEKWAKQFFDQPLKVVLTDGQSSWKLRWQKVGLLIRKQGSVMVWVCSWSTLQLHHWPHNWPVSWLHQSRNATVSCVKVLPWPRRSIWVFCSCLASSDILLTLLL